MDTNTLILTIAYTLSILLSLVLAYALVNKVFKAKHSPFIGFLCLGVWAVVMAISTNMIDNVPFVYIISFIGGVILINFLFKFTLYQSYLCSCFVLFHLIALKGITIGAMSLLLGENSFMILSDKTTEMISIIISQLLNIMMMFFYLKKVNVKETRNFLLNKKQLTYTLICNLIITVFMLFNSFTFYYNLDLVWISVAQILVGIILYFVYIIILEYGIKTADLIQHKLRSQIQLDTIQTQMRQQNSLMRMTEIINIFKHDYREHMLTIEDHIENKRYEEALRETKTDYLYELEKLPQTVKFSNNIILNSLLIDRKEACEAQGIKMDALLYHPLDLSISEKEFHEVLHILTDNAIEANEKVAKKDRYLTIRSKAEQQWLSVMVENPYEGIIHFENDLPVSSSVFEDEQGLGLIYIEELMEERQGIIRFDVDEKKKILKVVLLIRIESTSGGDI